MDDVAARREARRRKILENSQNRLSKITGIQQNSTPVINYYSESTEETPDVVDNTPEVSHDAKEEKVEKPKYLQKQYQRIVISALAVFINLLLSILDYLQFESSGTHVNKIFIPLFVYEVIQIFSLPKDAPQKKSFIHIIIANSRHKQLLPVIKYLELASVIMQDVMLYFFVFVCCEFIQYLLWTL